MRLRYQVRERRPRAVARFRGAALARDLAAALGPAPKGTSGVLVVGMHRSGTSALTEVVSSLGVSIGDKDDLMPADDANQRGYWESGKLTDFQELLLMRLGGSWDHPPPLREGWEQQPGLLREVGRARRIFSSLYGNSPQWVWKDPRTSLLLPFWRRALGIRPVVLIVHRNPLEVARSLSVRDGMSTRQALELWEVYNRAVLANVHGLRALVVSYGESSDNPVGATESVSGFLAASGLEVSCPPQGHIARALDPELRHAEFTSSDLDLDHDVTDAQRALAVLLHSLEGSHESFDTRETLGLL